MNSTNYVEILNECFYPFVRERYRDGDFYLHQDNSPVHKGTEAIYYLNQTNIRWVKNIK